MKIVGSILVCGSCGLMGLFFSMQGERRVTELSEFKKALWILKSEIAYSLNPLPEAFLHISTRTAGHTAAFYGALSQRLSDKNGTDINTAWNECLQAEMEKSYLVDEDMLSLAHLGHTLGYLDKEQQLGSIELIISYIDDKMESLNVSNIKNKKMFRDIGIIGGFLVTVVLI